MPNPLLTEIQLLRDDSQAAVLSRFFKTGPGQYGEGDVFLGVKVPQTRHVVKKYWQEVSFDDLSECLASQYHEVRLAALLTLMQFFKQAKVKNDINLQRRCIDFYLAHMDAVNNWDLGDLSCYELLGTWLLDKDRSLLYQLARHGKSIWEQRIGIVSTMQFVRHGETDDTLAIAEILLTHPHDLIHKAIGWLLREVGKRDRAALTVFLMAHKAAMPRTALRYAIEHYPQEERRRWLAKRL